MVRIFIVLTAVLAWTAQPHRARAQEEPWSQEPISEIDPIDIPPEHDPLAHAWDRPGERGGFYLRGMVGLGANSTLLGPAPWQSDSDELRARGFASGYTLDLGGFVRPYVALHLNSHAGILWSGELERGLAVADDDEVNVRVGAYGFAPAATFVVPHDFFFTTAFGVGFARVEQPGHRNVTDPGFYMSLVAGKDFYVDDHVAVGIQMQLVYMLLDDESPVDEARVRQFLFGLSLAYDSI